MKHAFYRLFKDRNQELRKFNLTQKQIKVSTQARARPTNLMQDYNLKVG